jgi:hypothetical protein
MKRENLTKANAIVDEIACVEQGIKDINTWIAHINQKEMQSHDDGTIEDSNCCYNLLLSEYSGSSYRVLLNRYSGNKEIVLTIKTILMAQLEELKKELELL